MKTSCVIIPVHNRRDTTLTCLAQLRELGAYDWADVIVVDDGSTDGTREAIEAEFPTVIVLAGDGNLWWAGGINVGMRFVKAHSYKTFFWLNDDCRPHPQTLAKMLLFSQRNHGVCTAVSVTPSGYSYGGFKKTAWGLKRVNSGECDTFGGNCVCFPASVIDRVGYLDAVHFPMDPADADYGLRVKKAGYPVVALEGAICENDDNLSEGKSSWLFSAIPLSSYLNNFFRNRHHCSYIPTMFRFKVRHWKWCGILSATGFYVRFLLFALIRTLVPKRILSRFAPHSVVWRKAQVAEQMEP